MSTLSSSQATGTLITAQPDASKSTIIIGAAAGGGALLVMCAVVGVLYLHLRKTVAQSKSRLHLSQNNEPMMMYSPTHFAGYVSNSLFDNFVSTSLHTKATQEPDLVTFSAHHATHTIR